VGHSGVVNAVAISPDGGKAVSGSYDETLKVWDLSSGRELNTLVGHSDVVTAVAISSDGQTAISGSWDHTLRLWDLSSGHAFHTLKGHSDKVYAVAISLNGQTAVSGSNDKTLKVWDLSTPAESFILLRATAGWLPLWRSAWMVRLLYPALGTTPSGCGIF
jgi:WD40 repeat protein